MWGLLWERWYRKCAQEGKENGGGGYTRQFCRAQAKQDQRVPTGGDFEQKGKSHGVSTSAVPPGVSSSIRGLWSSLLWVLPVGQLLSWTCWEHTGCPVLRQRLCSWDHAAPEKAARVHAHLSWWVCVKGPAVASEGSFSASCCSLCSKGRSPWGSVQRELRKDSVLALEMKSALLQAEQWLSRSLCTENRTSWPLFFLCLLHLPPGFGHSLR